MIEYELSIYSTTPCVKLAGDSVLVRAYKFVLGWAAPKPLRGAYKHHASFWRSQATELRLANTLNH